ncbi:MAG: carbohydrate ABC transporter permease [Cellulosilyticaceae bacterium]
MKNYFNFSSLSYKKQQRIITWLFLAMPLLLLILFTYLPLTNMIKYSFLNWDGFSKNKTFVGIDNYKRIFSTPEYFSVFKVSLYYLVGSFIQIGMGLLLATFLSFKLKGKNFFKGILFFPYLINGVAVGFIFLFFFRPNGVLDTLLTMIGLEEYIQLWLGNPKIINYSLTFASIWKYMGLNLIMFLGSIQSIGNDLYEASDLDGASRWQQFRYIIFPIIKPIVNLNLLLSVKGALTVFEMPYIITGGGNGSSTFVIKTVDTAFKYNKVGLASAMGIVLLIIIIFITLVQNIIFREKKEA